MKQNAREVSAAHALTESHPGMQSPASRILGAILETLCQQRTTAVMQLPLATGVQQELLRRSIAAIDSAEKTILSELCGSVEKTRNGPSVAQLTFEADQLTETELKVLKLAAAGHVNKEIARALKCSEHTVQSHMKHIYSKMGIHSRVQMFTTLKRNKLLEDLLASYELGEDVRAAFGAAAAMLNIESAAHKES